jgi:hypothetical protein
MFKKNYALWLLLVLICQPLHADDLDDSIGGDEAIEDKLQINKNIEYIKRNEMAKAKRGAKNTIVNCGAGNQAFGAGTKFKANTTIVNLSNNKNAVSICGKKPSAADEE